MAYSRDGQGLHRSVDPVDGEAYVYGNLFLDAAPTVFACFDQPDLKAPYAVSVTAPDHWTVLGNGAADRGIRGVWSLTETPPLATYFVTICAGPWAGVRSDHDGIPLGVHARASLREPLERQAEQILELTATAFDYYHDLFGIRYPFGEYHQVFVPEFNAGAMENPGCVTIRDAYLFRGAVTRDELLGRASTIVHEIAHMWFGDLVTMRWWDDLWLNESFAEYLAHRACVAVTEFTDAWVDSTMARTLWGHSAERAPSRHPVAGRAADAAAALNDFDGISYAKGCGVLRQLIAHVGDEAFVAGIRDHLRDHAFGTAEFADFLAAMERASGESLGEWAEVWLRTSGLDDLTVDRDRRVARRTTPDIYPPASRRHTFDVAGFAAGREVFRSLATRTRDDFVWPEEGAAADVIIANAGDLTWATTLLDDRSLAALPGRLAEVPDAQARAVAWVALIDGVHRGIVDPRVALEVLERAWPTETNESILNRAGSHVVARLIPAFLPRDEQSAAGARVCRAAHVRLRAAPTSGIRLIAARIVARTATDESLLRRWLAGTDVPTGLVGDVDFRWILIKSLARQGFCDDREVEHHRIADGSLAGQQAALAARALRPDPEAKAWAWDQLTANPDRSNYDLAAIAGGFWVAPDLRLVTDYVPRYFAEIPALADRIGEDALGRLATAAYPSVVVEESTLAAGREAIEGAALSPAVRRSVVDAQAQLHEAITSRSRFDPPRPAP